MNCYKRELKGFQVDGVLNFKVQTITDEKGTRELQYVQSLVRDI
jgi:hypothetical protein